VPSISLISYRPNRQIFGVRQTSRRRLDPAIFFESHELGISPAWIKLQPVVYRARILFQLIHPYPSVFLHSFDMEIGATDKGRQQPSNIQNLESRVTPVHISTPGRPKPMISSSGYLWTRLRNKNLSFVIPQVDAAKPPPSVFPRRTPPSERPRLDISQSIHDAANRSRSSNHIAVPHKTNSAARFAVRKIRVMNQTTHMMSGKPSVSLASLRKYLRHIMDRSRPIRLLADKLLDKLWDSIGALVINNDKLIEERSDGIVALLQIVLLIS
jgi:hypothetical protein